MLRLQLILSICLGLLAGLGCHSQPAATSVEPPGPITNYPARGVVKGLPADGKTVIIRHEDIPDFMESMTMPFKVRDPGELRGITNGSVVTFRLRVTATEGWIDQLKRVAAESPAISPTNLLPTDVRIVPMVAVLSPGDAVPNYTFTNQLGQSFDLKSLQGQVVVLDFIFTRCPFPEFCPFLSRHFAALQHRLKETPGGTTNCHLVTVTFDPKYDTVDRLKAYGRIYGADPDLWSLSTAPMDTVERLAGHFELYFARDVEPAQQNHNLRTVVLDRKGRLARVFKGNAWTDNDLAEAVAEAGK